MPDGHVQIAIDAQDRAMPVFQRLEDAIKTGFGQRIGASFADLSAKLAQLGKMGFAFNETLESAQVSLAAIYRQFAPDKFGTFTDALQASVATIKELKVAATETSATFEELLLAYQGLAGAAFAAGIPMDKQVRLVVAISQAMGTLNIPGNQLLQEGRALLSGNIGPDAMLAKMLGISGADIARSKASGSLNQFLTAKLAAFGEGAGAASKTWRVRKSNFSDITTNLASVLTEPTFRMASDALGKLIQRLSTPEVVTACDKLGELIAKIAAFAVGGGGPGDTNSGFGMQAAGIIGAGVAGRWGVNKLAAMLPGLDWWKLQGTLYRMGGGMSGMLRGASVGAGAAGSVGSILALLLGQYGANYIKASTGSGRGQQWDWDWERGSGQMSADPRFAGIRNRSMAAAAASKTPEIDWIVEQSQHYDLQRKRWAKLQRDLSLKATGEMADTLLGLGGANLASRISSSGTFATRGAAQAWVYSLNINKAMLDVLRDIRKFFEDGIRLAPGTL